MKWAKGKSKAEALQEAKREMLRKNPNPFSLAAFVMVREAGRGQKGRESCFSPGSNLSSLSDHSNFKSLPLLALESCRFVAIRVLAKIMAT
jgi:hypothetical protein